MHFRKPRRKPPYSYVKEATDIKPLSKRRGGSGTVMFILLAAAIFLISAALFLKEISTQIAVSDASDIVTVNINDAISDIMKYGDYTGDYFVTLERSETGEVNAICSNMARINSLSAEILGRIVGATENHTITVEIPIGNLSGISVLMGRGPKVPVEIITLTSSKVEFSNSIVTAGINQTKHQINLEVIVDIDVLIPWGTQSTQVVTEVLIADTVIVGKVPDTYLNVQ